MTGAAAPPPPNLPAPLAGGPTADTVRLAAIEALARRAQALHGEARQGVEARLAQWREAAAASPAPAAWAPMPVAAPGPLAGLLAHLARETGTADGTGSAPGAATRQGADPLHAAMTELKAVRQHRSTWSRLSVDQRLAQAGAQVSTHAGPLNTPWLLHQALQVLRDTSPAYLHRLMTQVEALLALAPASAPAAPARKDAARSPRERKPGRTPAP